MQNAEVARLLGLPKEGEIPRITPIDNLFILVHPLDEPLGVNVHYGDHVKKIRKQIFTNALHRFVPVTRKEVLVVVPNSGPSVCDLLHEKRITETEMDVFKTPYSWITIEEEARRLTEYPRNVMLGDNVPLLEVPSSKIEQRLKKHGFSIEPETKIILGGEYIENCLADTARDFLTLPQVKDVYIDRLATLGITDYVSTSGRIDVQSFIEAIRRLRKFGYLATSDGGEYIRVERP